MSEPRLTVMIVDDDQAFGGELSDLLQNSGYRPVVCTAVGVALGVAQQQRPDIILLDIKLGDVGGYQLAEALRQDQQLAAVPIIAMSAYFDRQPYAIIRSHYGIKWFLAKPFNQTDITAIIEQALRIGRAVDAPRECDHGPGYGPPETGGLAAAKQHCTKEATP